MNVKELGGDLISAVIYIVLGVMLLLNPDASLSLICTVIGISAIVYGALNVLFYFVRRNDEDSSRFTLPMGIAFAAVGLFCLVAPKVVLSVLPLIFGIVLLIDGAGKLGRSLELRKLGFARWGTLAALAVVILVLGLMLVTRPYEAVENVARIFGAMLVADGLIGIYFSVRVFGIRKNR